MRVLQSLGEASKTVQAGVFQYRRTDVGVELDLSIGQAPSVLQPKVLISHRDWVMLLRAFVGGKKVFRLTRKAGKASVYDRVEQVFRTLPSCSGVAWNDSYAACIAAILEHEGSLDLHGGRSGPIHLKRDF
jgi:hypothetical protein